MDSNLRYVKVLIMVLLSVTWFRHCHSTKSEATLQYSTLDKLAECNMPVVQHGSPLEKKSNYTEGEKAEILCDNGYRVPFTNLRMMHMKCGTDGVWQNLLQDQRDINPFCERIGGCHAPSIPNMMPTRVQDYMPGDLLPLVCKSGYTSYGTKYMVCVAGGFWQMKDNPSEIPKCLPSTCKVTPEFPHGRQVDDTNDEVFQGSLVPEGSYIIHKCDVGYAIDDLHNMRQKCINGKWSGSHPKCVKAGPYGTDCRKPQTVKHAKATLFPTTDAVVEDDVVPDGSSVQYTCDVGYISEKQEDLTLFCLGGVWNGGSPICSPLPKECGPPPTIANGTFVTVYGDNVAQKYWDGLEVFYYCQNKFKPRNSNQTRLECRAGHWHGAVPVCKRRTHCDRPQDIPNGNWQVQYFLPEYGITTRIIYTCQVGYKTMGTSVIECESSAYWSDHAPRCLPANQYCSEPGPVENGIYMCSPSHCALFKVGTDVHYVCNKGFEPQPADQLVQRCLPGGHWDVEKPKCYPVNTEATTDDFMYLDTNTVTVVIATSCGVLGLLVVVMVIVALQRRKKPRSSRLCHPSTPSPPPYPTPPTGLVDDPDRVALIAFADGVQVVLPTYEEAIRGRTPSRLSRYNSDSTRGSIRSSSSRGDYRPLPSLPHGLRTGGAQIREVPMDHHYDHHRNSIITTTSITTRDNLSLALGSLDTVNISDGTSTSVTVDTASSNPSIATSQRATAGSIESSSTNGSLANEDAPLLDQNHTNTETIRSHHSNNSDTLHSHNSRCQCTERIGGYDTIHSQSSRSQSESSPIVEVPEEHKQT